MKKVNKKDKSIESEPIKRDTQLITTEITAELEKSYLDYAMSVIVSRALPDVRDGLKPVHRRILWAMWDMGLTHGAKFVKSARVVGECFVKDTLVNTTKGLVPIQDIQEGDTIYTQHGTKRVSQLYEMPPKELLRVNMENGQYNTVTPSQKFKVVNKNLSFEWKEAKDLTANDYIVTRSIYSNNEKNIFIGTFRDKKIFFTEDFAYLLGLYTSDGWTSHDYTKKGLSRVGFCGSDKQILLNINRILGDVFEYRATLEKKIYSVKPNVTSTLYTIRINSKEINDFFIKHFSMERAWALTKEIPKQIFQSPSSVIYAFISGLFDGDGYISAVKNKMQYTSVSEKLIQQLSTLLLALDVHGNIYTKKSLVPKRVCILNGREIHERNQSYSLEIYGKNAHKLASYVHLYDEKKAHRVQRLILNEGTKFEKGANRYDIIPYAGEVLFGELSRMHKGGGWYTDTNGHSFRMGIHYYGGTKIRYSSDIQTKPLRMAQIVSWGIADKLKRTDSCFFPFVEEVIQNNLRFAKVSHVEKHTAEHTYDIQVEGDHEFIANGMLVHNCMGKYHPHGDSSIYDAMVRMAQNFSLRYPLVHGQGNFGSQDGDGAAAQRYTECRLTKIAEEMLLDIEKNTVDFIPNYDASRQEPSVLPSKIPQLLLNGTTGIAVGMATDIPPHNLTEVVDATLHLIENPNATTQDLMKFIQGPDFPTGGLMYDRKNIVEVYTTGQGAVTCRARTEITERKPGQYNIVISEIPYRVNKSELVQKIASLVGEKKLEGIKDLRDESDRDGLSVVIELKNDAAPQKILNQLFKLTELQKNFNLNMIGLVQGGTQPQSLSIKDILDNYLAHRQVVVRRRTEFDLGKAKDREHILEGLVTALDHIDAVITTIKKSKDKEEAHTNLKKKFGLSDLQATAILEIRLQTLASLERQKIDDELSEKRKLIKELQRILSSVKNILEVVKQELIEIKESYGDARRTQLVDSGLSTFTDEDLIAQEEVVVTMSSGGYIKRVSPDIFKVQHRGGKGLIGSDVGDDDFLTHLKSAHTHDNALFFTDSGKVFQTKVYEIPQGSRTSKGKIIHNFLDIPASENVRAFVTYNAKDSDIKFLIMATKDGVIKKTPIEDFANVRRNGIIALNLKKGDALKWVMPSSGKDEIILITMGGQAIRFKESQLRPMGRTASGVRGIKLKKNDEVVGIDLIKQGADKKQNLLVVMSKGFAKQTPVNEYKVQSRGGQGIRTAKVTDKTGKIVSFKMLTNEEEVIVLSAKGQVIRTKLADIRQSSRATSGVRVMRLDDKDGIVSSTCL